MIFNKQNEEYTAPSFVVVDVVCEAGFINSLGELTFDNASEGENYEF
ncbi:MAG: hypothetical protein J6V21_05715 [Alistipes sp.]|nr:hypothetical protein [Alistipes sp.]